MHEESTIPAPPDTDPQLLATTNARHLSKSVEHYTPSKIVESARSLLGGIDLDPASCGLANCVVGADHFWTAAESPLDRPWSRCVFLNPPGGKVTGKSSQVMWWRKLVHEWSLGNVSAAVFVSFSVELFQTSQVAATTLLPLDFLICFPSRRVAYMKEAPDGTLVAGTSPPHSSAIVYLPPSRKRDRWSIDLDHFVSHFGWLGACRDLRVVDA